jgi:hypothetical protein
MKMRDVPRTEIIVYHVFDDDQVILFNPTKEVKEEIYFLLKHRPRLCHPLRAQISVEAEGVISAHLGDAKMTGKTSAVISRLIQMQARSPFDDDIEMFAICDIEFPPAWRVEFANYCCARLHRIAGDVTAEIWRAAGEYINAYLFNRENDQEAFLRVENDQKAVLETLKCADVLLRAGPRVVDIAVLHVLPGNIRVLSTLENSIRDLVEIDKALSAGR